MNDLRQSILKQQLQKELELARELEAKGDSKEAGIHYMKAGALSRRIAYISPREQAEELFSTASQYEQVGDIIKTTSGFERAKNPDLIDSLIVTEKPEIKWEDIGGLEEAKKTIKEAIILPFIESKPEFITAPRTILLYGPAGTGKTLLAKASSNTLDATFFEAKGSGLLSKYFGESSKLIEALFGKAKKLQPSLIFMDEIDSLAPTRLKDVSEAGRRVLGQLLEEIEGFNTRKEDKILFIGATNKPWDLDDAMLSRFQRKIYVPLPDLDSRKQIFEIQLKGADLSVSLGDLANRSEGYSGRDIANVCQEAIIHMVRQENPHLQELTPREISKYSLKYRALMQEDFEQAFAKIKPPLSKEIIERYAEWAKETGG